jgi:glutamate carboxypeptidase
VAANIVSPESYLQGEIRSFDNAKMTTAMMEIGALSAIEGMPADVAVKILHPALEVSKAGQALYKSARAIAAEMGYALPAGASGGASDGSSLAHAGIPVLDGLGMKGGGAHRNDEHIELDDFAVRATLLTALVLDLSAHG